MHTGESSSCHSGKAIPFKKDNIIELAKEVKRPGESTKAFPPEE